MLERCYPTLKTATMARHDPPWSRVLPFVLRGLRAAAREEFAASRADLMYAENLRLPNELAL